MAHQVSMVSLMTSRCLSCRKEYPHCGAKAEDITFGKDIDPTLSNSADVWRIIECEKYAEEDTGV